MARGRHPSAFARAGGQAVAAALRAQAEREATKPDPRVFTDCSACLERTTFSYDDVEGWVSDCCTARPFDPSTIVDLES